MRYFIVAGEKSGDLHGSNLIAALKEQDPEADIVCWGGDAMEEAGARLLRHYKNYSLMGFAEIISKLPTLLRSIKECKKAIADFKPDALILIDFAGFNLRLAKFAHGQGFQVLYYISPKLWAWNQKRAYKIKRYVHRMFVIMHFEKAFYKKFGYEVDYVGNPLLDAVKAFQPDPEFFQANRLTRKPIIALLPGSRHQEVKLMLPPMIEAAKPMLQQYHVVVAGVDHLPNDLYLMAQEAGIPIIFNATYDILNGAHAAIVTSGTATLETALFNVPQVVAYKTSPLTYHIAKWLIQVPYISLVNLIANKEVVKEMIQEDCTAPLLKDALDDAIKNAKSIKQDYAHMRALIETDESVSARTAKLMVAHLRSR